MLPENTGNAATKHVSAESRQALLRGHQQTNVGKEYAHESGLFGAERAIQSAEETCVVQSVYTDIMIVMVVVIMKIIIIVIIIITIIVITIMIILILILILIK
jgi:type IV secretory pathway component VirB8